MKAVIYARYSSDNQREESIEGQIRECTDFAEKNGITILRHYIDRAFSAKTDNRPEFQNMIKDSAQGLFDIVLVWKLDRFSRNRYDSAHYKSILKKNNVKVVSATEKISEGSEGILMESILEGFAEYYSADLSEKIVRGMTENALKCKFNGGGHTIGYVIDEEQYFQLDPLTAPLVLEAFKMYDKGATMKEIRDWINDQGFRNSRDKPIGFNGVENILKNRRYLGEYRYRDILVPDGIPQIVPQDLFDRVQVRMEKNKKSPARYKAEDEYILSGKLYCGYCGEPMIGESGTGRNGVHHYYKCSSIKRKLKDCSKKTMKKDWLEDTVIQAIKEFLDEPGTVDAVIELVMDLQGRDSVSLPAFEKQLSETNTAIDNLLNAIQQGILTKSTKERLEQLEASRDELEQKIALEKMAKPKVSEDFIRFFLKRFQYLDTAKLEHRKMLIGTFVNAIYLYDDKAVIALNYKDGTKTVNFNDMECALSQRASIPGSDLEILSPPEKALKSKDFRAFSYFSGPDFSRRLEFDWNADCFPKMLGRMPAPPYASPETAHAGSAASCPDPRDPPCFGSSPGLHPAPAAAASQLTGANESVEALRELAANGPLTIQMSPYGGFEQVGSLGTSLPRNDVQTVTEAGDIVLYSGSNIVVFYGSNSWAYTRLGKITGLSQEELEELLGTGDISITVSLS